MCVSFRRIVLKISLLFHSVTHTHNTFCLKKKTAHGQKEKQARTRMYRENHTQAHVISLAENKPTVKIQSAVTKRKSEPRETQ